MVTTASIKGQVVIPSSIRRRFGIKEGTWIHIDADEKTHHITLTPITRDYIFSLRGKYKGKGLMKTLMEERHKEKEL